MGRAINSLSFFHRVVSHYAVSQFHLLKANFTREAYFTNPMRDLFHHERRALRYMLSAYAARRSTSVISFVSVAFALFTQL